VVLISKEHRTQDDPRGGGEAAHDVSRIERSGAWTVETTLGVGNRGEHDRGFWFPNPRVIARSGEDGPMLCGIAETAWRGEVGASRPRGRHS